MDKEYMETVDKALLTFIKVVGILIDEQEKTAKVVNELMELLKKK